MADTAFLSDPSLTGPATPDFGKHLVDESAGRKKSERTRAAICRAGAALLDAQPLASLTVHDICREADIAHGTFYIYFKDRQTFVAELLLRFVSFIQDILRDASRDDGADPVRASTAAYYELFAHNRGLMKCMIFHLDEFPETRSAFQHLNHEWIATVVAAAERQLGKTGGRGRVDRDELFRRAYALGGMVDQYLASLLLSRDPGLIEVSRDRAQVIDTLTHIWKQGLRT